jgi:hypothetical protein
MSTLGILAELVLVARKMFDFFKYFIFLKGSTLEVSSVFAGYCVLIAEKFILVLFFSLEPTDPRLITFRMDRAIVGIFPY